MNRLCGALLTVVLFARPVTAQETLRSVLTEHHVSGYPAAAMDQRISSFATHDSSDVFFIAYYAVDSATRALADTLRVSVFDKRARTWRVAAIPRQRPSHGADEAAPYLGSIMDIHATATQFLLDTHINPSAGAILVLTRDLKPVTTLYGWVLRILPGGVVVYHRSTIHFAETHAAELWIYNPRTERDALLYPKKPFGPVRTVFGERYASALQDSVVASGASIAFAMSFGSDSASSAAAVFCRDAAAANAHCVELRLSSLKTQHPGWSTTQILTNLLSSR